MSSERRVPYSPLHGRNPSSAATDTMYPDVQPPAGASGLAYAPNRAEGSPEHKRNDTTASSSSSSFGKNNPNPNPNAKPGATPVAGGVVAAPGFRGRVSAANEWMKGKVPAHRRGRFFWIMGGLLAAIWTIAIFAHAAATSRCVYWYNGECHGNYPSHTLGYVVLTFFLVGILGGFLFAYKWSDRSARGWCRFRDRPARDPNAAAPPAPAHGPNATAEGGIANQPASVIPPHGNAGYVEPILTPRSQKSSGNLGSSLLVAIFPFAVVFTLIGVWFGFQIGAVASILTYNSSMDQWAFSFGIFFMMVSCVIFTIMGWADRLVPALTSVDPALVDWSSNDGLAPLGKFVYGFLRGVAISGWFALLGVLVGTLVGLPATLLGGIGFALLLVAIVIVGVAIWAYKHRKPHDQAQGVNAGPAAPPVAGGGVPLQGVVVDQPYGSGSMSSPHRSAPTVNVGDAPIEISSAPQDAELMYLRGLAMMNGSPHHAKDPSGAAQMIMSSAQLGYGPAQEHLRQLLLANAAANEASAAANVGSPPHMAPPPVPSRLPAYAVHPGM